MRPNTYGSSTMARKPSTVSSVEPVELTISAASSPIPVTIFSASWVGSRASTRRRRVGRDLRPTPGAPHDLVRQIIASTHGLPVRTSAVIVGSSLNLRMNARSMCRFTRHQSRTALRPTAAAGDRLSVRRADQGEMPTLSPEPAQIVHRVRTGADWRPVPVRRARHRHPTSGRGCPDRCTTSPAPKTLGCDVLCSVCRNLQETRRHPSRRPASRSHTGAATSVTHRISLTG